VNPTFVVLFFFHDGIVDFNVAADTNNVIAWNNNKG
jgi:hypothetical protein